MKQGKRPNKAQSIRIQRQGLNAEEWLVCKDTSKEMTILHRESGQLRTIRRQSKG